MYRLFRHVPPPDRRRASRTPSLSIRSKKHSFWRERDTRFPSLPLPFPYPRILIASNDHAFVILPEKQDVLVGSDRVREPFFGGEIEPDVRRRRVDNPMEGASVVLRGIATRELD